MKKYVLLFKNEVEKVLEFRVALFSRTALDVAVFYAAYVFWQVVYSEHEIVKGLDFNGMTTYLLVAFVLSVLSRSSMVSLEIQKFVSTGELSSYLSKPMSTLSMVFVRSLANTFIMMIVGIMLFTMLSSWCGVNWKAFEIGNLMLGVSCLVPVVLLSFLLFALVGCLSFWLI